MRGTSTKPPPGTTIDWSHPLSRNLIGCWNLAEGNGLYTYDSTGKYGSGLLRGDSGLPTWVGGKNNTALSFTAGNNHSVNIATNSSYSMAAGNYGWHVRFRVTTLVDGSGIVSKSTGSSQLPFDLFVMSSGLMTFVFGDTSQAGLGGVVANRWTDVILTQSATWGGSAKIWQDGRIIYSTTSGIGVAGDTGTITLGNRIDYLRDLTGQIEFFHMWNRAILPDEAAQLFANPYCFMNKTSPKVWTLSQGGAVVPSFDWYVPMELAAPPVIEVVSY